MIKQYIHKGTTYSLKPCMLEDIPSHVERVSFYWKQANIDMEEQLRHLRECITDGVAIQIHQDEEVYALLYGKYLEKKTFLHCFLFYLKNKGVLSALAPYLRDYLGVTECIFFPHKQEKIPFEFLVSEVSIKNHYYRGTPLVIDLFSKECNKLYNKFVTSNSIREV